MEPSDSTPARLLDGRSGVPVQGQARIEGIELRFVSTQGTALNWSMDQVLGAERVAGNLHVELDQTSLETDATPLPSARLELQGLALEGPLDDAQRLFGSSRPRGAKRTSRRLGLGAWLLIAAIVVPAAYALYAFALPRMHVFIPHEWERALGDFVFDAVKADWVPLEDPQFDALAARMVSELKDPELPFDLRVTLIDEDKINALALPGGRILVFKGLVTAAPSADALAGVLAHEIAHVEQRHGLQHLLRSMGILHFAGGAVGGGLEGFESAETLLELSSGLLILKHSRRHEREADRIGVAKLRRTKRRALGLVEFFEALQDQSELRLLENLGWLSTHPVSSDRIEAVQRLAAKQTDSKPWLAPDQWQALQARLRE